MSNDELSAAPGLAEIAGLPLADRAEAYALLLEELRRDLETDGRA